MTIIKEKFIVAGALMGIALGGSGWEIMVGLGKVVGVGDDGDK